MRKCGWTDRQTDRQTDGHGEASSRVPQFDERAKKFFRSAHTVYLCGLCGSQDKQRLFPYTTLIGWTFSNYQLNAQFFYFSTICVLHYAPQHVSSSTLLILRRTSCITTASGIVTLCKQRYSMQVESGLQSALHLHTVRL